MSYFDGLYGLLVRSHSFLMGAGFALSVIASILFLRFYRRTGDRLFVFFFAAFALMALNRVAFQVIDLPDENQPALYLVRLIAFGLILFAIFDKNRRPSNGRPLP